jgi:peptidoglycan/LPS O-acetylase OafA/YrhL
MSGLPLPSLVHVSPIPLLYGSTRAIPQGWSIGIEMSFYLIAPLLVVLGKRSVWPLFVLALAATFLFVYATLTLDPQYINQFVYRNAFTTAFMFLWGSVAYVIQRNTKAHTPFFIAAAAVSIMGYYLSVWPPSDELGSGFIAASLLAIPVGGLVCLTIVPNWLRQWETRVGDLSYGIYLNHCLVAGILMWIAEASDPHLFGMFKQPQFGISVAVASALVAALTFNVVERPIEVLQRKVKEPKRWRDQPRSAEV